MMVGTVKVIIISSSSPHVIIAVDHDRNLPRIGGREPSIVKGRVVVVVGLATAIASDLVGGKGGAMLL
jgi:hypothetical protein